MAYGSHLHKQEFLDDERQERKNELERLKSSSEAMIDMMKDVQRLRAENKKINEELQLWLMRLSRVCTRIQDLIK